jgi:serine/threonine-protein kinase
VSTADPEQGPTTPPGAGTNWSRVEQLFHDARELPADQRHAFLVRACDGDSALQRDVESLLAQSDGPLLGGGVQTLARQMTRGIREGSRLGPYVLGPLIGEGGMGEVYRARDPRLGRDVAIKLLPPDLAQDPGRLRRSEREARVLASLNHPNIATLFGLEESDGISGLVLELVPGLTLQQQLAARGPMRLDEAVAVARQIADALDAAHQHGIVHRDLKPANITITPEGVVKVLDFGLARIDVAGLEGSDGAVGLTVAGRMIGTPAYMSPEQARGAATDRRTDIWAFGCVLFEMLTGERVFQGDSVADTVAAIIHRDPPLDRLPPATPSHVRATIERCLQKDARDRARDISDVRMALEGAFSGPMPVAPVARARASVRWLTAAALAGAVLAVAAAWLFTTPPPVDAPDMRFQVTPPPGLTFGRFALSPDGRNLAFTDASEGRSGLWVHSFETGQSRHLDRAGQFTTSVFWSPDSRSIGFFARGAIHRIAIDGTPPQQITMVDRAAGAEWLADGSILYGRLGGGLLKVPSSGGTPVPVTELDAARGEAGHTEPVMLPDGRRFLYLRLARDPQQSGVFVGSLDLAPSAQSTQPLLSPATPPFLSQSADGTAHLLFVRDGTLLAQELDLASMTLSGQPSVLVERVASRPGTVPLVSVAGDTLAIRAPDAPSGGVPVWFDRDGRRAGPVFATAVPPLQLPQLSPDGTRLAAIVDRSLWVFPLDGRPSIRLTPGGSLSPLWTPDGQSIVYEQYGAVAGLHAVAADGSSSAPRAVGPAGHLHAQGFLDAGRSVLAGFESPQSPGAWSLVKVPWSGAGARVRIPDIEMRTPSVAAVISPDGRWLAYLANTTGRAELWVRRYPGLDGIVRISPNGAAEPVWSKDGRELFYLEDDTLMRVRVRPATSGRFEYEPPVRLTAGSFLRMGQAPSFDVAADGRLLMLEPLPPQQPTPIEVTVNWPHLPR